MIYVGLYFLAGWLFAAYANNLMSEEGSDTTFEGLLLVVALWFPILVLGVLGGIAGVVRNIRGRKRVE